MIFNKINLLSKSKLIIDLEISYHCWKIVKTMKVRKNKIKRICKLFFKITNQKNRVKYLQINKIFSMIQFMKNLKIHLQKIITNNHGKLKNNNIH